MIMAILAVGLALAITFALYKDTEAQRQEVLAVANATEAMKQKDKADRARKDAEEQRKMAVMNAIEAERQRKEAMEALENCRKKR